MLLSYSLRSYRVMHVSVSSRCENELIAFLESKLLPDKSDGAKLIYGLFLLPPSTGQRERPFTWARLGFKGQRWFACFLSRVCLTWHLLKPAWIHSHQRQPLSRGAEWVRRRGGDRKCRRVRGMVRTRHDIPVRSPPPVLALGHVETPWRESAQQIAVWEEARRGPPLRSSDSHRRSEDGDPSRSRWHGRERGKKGRGLGQRRRRR